MPDVNNDEAIKSNREWLKYYSFFVQDYLLIEPVVRKVESESHEHESDCGGETIMYRILPIAARWAEWPGVLGKSHPNV
jgi:hypothetical protein